MTEIRPAVEGGGRLRLLAAVSLLLGGLWWAPGPVRADEQPEADGRPARYHLRQAGVAGRRGDWRVAGEHYRRALDAYTRQDRLKARRRLLEKLRRPRRKWPRRAAATFASLWKLERHLDQLLRRARKLPRRPNPPEDIDAGLLELSEQAVRLEKTARRLADPLCRSRALELQARLAAASGYPDEERAKLEQAAEACGQQACPGRARQLLERLARLAEAAGDLAGAYRLLARANAQRLAGLSKQQRRYRRSEALARLCPRLRAADPLACLRLEKQAVGFATFTDFSTRSLPGPPSKYLLAEVHAEYLPLLNWCLERAARRGEVAAGDRFELFWAVTNQGRTDRVRIDPPGVAPRLRSCLGKALRLFRYPRYRGERRTVTVPLVVGGH